MDPNALHAALAATLNPDLQARQAAETVLKELDNVPGYLPTLFLIVKSTEVATEIRQAGVIYLKNLVHKQWGAEFITVNDGEPQRVPFSPEDKQAVRSGIIDALTEADHLTRPQLVEILRRILIYDFPDRMPGFIEQMAAGLDVTTQDPKRTRACLLACRALYKVYEYKPPDKRVALINALPVTLPLLASLLEVLLTPEAPAAQQEIADEFIKLAVKTFWSCVHQSIPAGLQEIPEFMRWMTILYRVIERPVPASAVKGPNDDNAEVAKRPYWTGKRWAVQIMHRLIHRYGNPRALEKVGNRQHEVGLSQAFHDQVAAKFMQLFLQVLAATAQGHFLPERLLVEALNYLMSCISLAVTWLQLKPHAMDLATQVLFPVLCFTPADAELWECDPIEFIRTCYDIMEDCTSPRVAASSLMVDLCRKRTKTCLNPMVEFVHTVFREYAAGTADAGRKDGAMYCFGAIAAQLQEEAIPELTQLVWTMILEFVATELKSSHGHLRGRSCWVLGQFGDFLAAKDSSLFVQAVGGVAQMLEDPHLPVRFQAAVSLRMLVYDPDRRAAQPAVEEHVGAVLPQIITHLFNLMDQVGSDELVSTLDVLIECYASSMPPYAEGLCTRLGETFIRLAAGDDNDHDSSVAASQCCSAVLTLLEAIKDNGELYVALEKVLVPLILRIVSPDETGNYPYTDYLEDAMEILTYMTYYAPRISPEVWTLFKPITTCFFDFAIDYLSNINLPFHNFISRGNAYFVATRENAELVFKMIQHVLENSQTGDRDVTEAAKLAETFLLNSKEAVGGFVAGITSMVVRRFAQNPPKKPNARSDLLKVLCCGLLSRADLALYALESHQATAPMMQAWFTAIVLTEPKDNPDGTKTAVRSHFKAERDKKICALGLTAILRQPYDNLPKSMQDGIGHVLAAVVTVLSDIETLRRRQAAPPPPQQQQPAQGAGGGAPDSHARILDVDDDKDEDTKATRSMDEVYAKLSQLEDGTCTFAELFGEDEDEDEEESFSSPIDDMDELLFFAQSFHELQTSNAAAVEHATTNVLSPQHKQILTLVLNAAHHKMAAAGAAAGQPQQAAAGSPQQPA